ncbi:SPOSA6832_04111, partial [Sporobolomyces salmonicolor]
MSSADQPSQFRAAQFTQKGGNLEVKTVQWQNPKEGAVSASPRPLAPIALARSSRSEEATAASGKAPTSWQGGKERVVLVTPSDRFSAKDYGIDERDMLVVGKQKIDEELRRRGGARLVIACDQPRDSLEEMLDGMRYGSDLVMLNPRKDRALELPIANILAKNISIRGAPFPDRHGIERALELAERTSIRIKVAEFRFDQQQVNEAWERMENRDKLVIRTHACGLNSLDQITRFRLVEGVQLPATPGMSVSGQVIQVGSGNARFKEGQHVCGLTYEGGLAEYCLLRQDLACTLRQQGGEHDPEVCVEAFDATHRRFEREQKEDKDERRRRDEMNERMGLKGDGVLCVYGEGCISPPLLASAYVVLSLTFLPCHNSGLARLALDILRRSSKSERIVLVTSSDRFKGEDYGIDERDILVIGKQKVDQELRRRGGARLVLATDQPRQGVEETLDGMRYGSDLVMLNPRKDRPLQLPIANILAKNISIRGAPWPDRRDIERALEFAEQNKIRVKVAQFRFDQQQVNEAWKRMENKDSFEAPVVVFQQTGQAA